MRNASGVHVTEREICIQICKRTKVEIHLNSCRENFWTLQKQKGEGNS